MLKQTNPFVRIGFLLSVGLAIHGCSKYENPVSSVSQGKFEISYDVEMSVTDMSGISYPLPDSLTSISPIRLIITDASTGQTHTWQDVQELSPTNTFTPGTYKVELIAETEKGGFVFSADSIVNLTADSPARISLTLKPEIAWIKNRFSSESSYSLNNLTYHSLKNGATDTASVTRPDIFIKSGETEIYADVSDKNGSSIRLLQGRPLALKKSTLYVFNAELNDDVLRLNDEDGDILSLVSLTDDLFKNASPEISTSGFSDNIPLPAVEGMTIDEAVEMNITSAFPLEHLYFAVESPLVNLLNGSTETFEIDFLNLTDEQKEIISASHLGFAINNDRTSATINFNKSIEGLASLISARSVFTLSAINTAGLVSTPKTLIVDTKSVSFDIEKVEDATIGLNIARVTLIPSMRPIEISDLTFMTGDGQICPIIESSESNDRINLDILIPEGINPVQLDLYFVGLKRNSFAVNRVIPDFAVFPDGYATSARLRIAAREEKISKALTRILSFTIDGGDVSVVERDTTNCTVVINGLRPETTYRLDANLTRGISLMTTKFKTEIAAPVPDGDFEDVDPLITFKNLPSGGRYALTSLDLVNRQNYTDISVYWPKGNWTSINDRTFCQNSKLKNTWYMQPSAEIAWEGVSGSKSMMIKSVGWDADGSPIPDWVPEPEAGTAKFSGIVPKIAHRSAGRLFLGKYSFSPSTMTEVYNEGVPFSSRPSSLNGFYKYVPDAGTQSDRGKVTIELVRRDATTSETVIASGELMFASCPDFKSFNVPLLYHRYDLHPTHLKIMFISSAEADDAPIDDINVPLTPNLERGAYIGSILWVDNLSFSY